MIFTKLHLKNWYSFKDCELDLTYPKKIKNNTIPYEFLENFPNIRVKRLVLISGANASGKTSFTKIIYAIKEFISQGAISTFLEDGLRNHDEKISFNVEFIAAKPIYILDLARKPKDEIAEYITEAHTQYDHLHSFDVEFDLTQKELKEHSWKYTYKCIPIKKQDSINSLRKTLETIDGNSIGQNVIFSTNTMDIDHPDHHHFDDYYFSSAKNFLSCDIENKFFKDINLDRSTLERCLKTFDPTIKSVSYASDQSDDTPKGFFINFCNNKSLQMSLIGNVAEDRHLLSQGTYEAIKLAKFLSRVIQLPQNRSFTYVLDENMSHVQCEIEKTMLNLIVQKISNTSQLFYTTHNYEVLEMNYPIHSYLFIKRDIDGNSEFIKAEKHFNKNDRSIVNYVRNDVLGTIPDTNLLDEILFED
jgi:AAA15 family ATPase/GTPase